jgi:tetratricopeptide (TPR) repeat protein
MKGIRCLVIIFSVLISSCATLNNSELDTSVPDINMKEKKFLDAYEGYSSLINLNKKNFTLYARRAEALNNLKRYDEAITDYTKSIQINK